MKTIVHHVAFLVEDLQATIRKLPPQVPVGPVETFPGEGTREVYIGDSNHQHSLLLLMEAISDGPYLKTYKKRGPGLHHLGVATDDFTGFSEGLLRQRLLLHPKSLVTVKKKKLWLCRPGLPLLIEVFEVPVIPEGQEPFIQTLEIPLGENEARMINDLLPGFVVRGSGKEPLIQLQGKRWPVQVRTEGAKVFEGIDTAGLDTHLRPEVSKPLSASGLIPPSSKPVPKA